MTEKRAGPWMLSSQGVAREAEGGSLAAWVWQRAPDVWEWALMPDGVSGQATTMVGGMVSADVALVDEGWLVGDVVLLVQPGHVVALTGDELDAIYEWATEGQVMP